MAEAPALGHPAVPPLGHPAASPLSGPGAADPRSRRRVLTDAWRAYAAAVRLGWATEANWADPVLFVIYQVAKPIASVLILVVMLDIVSGGQGDPGYRAYIVVGSALWAFVMGGMAGVAWAVLDDRERYRMLRYLAVCPQPMLLLLLGRGTARLVTAASGALITLAFGVLLLGVGFDLAAVDWPLLVASMALGLVAIVALGVLLGATVLMTRVDAWSYPEAVAGALFLATGAIFPIAVLPLAVQAFSLLLPLTWWLEGVRRALFPQIATGIGGTGSLWTDLTGTQVPDDTTLLVMLSLSTIAATVIAIAAYRWCEHRARERGLLDQTSGS